MDDEQPPARETPTVATGKRQERLALALKDNLRKRKAQQRARAAAQASPPIKSER